jgi:hypothetical protein
MKNKKHGIRGFNIPNIKTINNKVVITSLEFPNRKYHHVQVPKKS